MTKQQRSARVERFCIEVVRPGNSLSDAYRITFQPKHCSPKTINEKASRLRKTDKVEARVKILVAPVIQTAQLTYARWLQEVDRVAICDPRKLFDTHGNPIDIPNLGDEEAPVIAGFEITEEFSGKGADRVPVGYTRKFKLVDKLKALELAGKARKFMEQDDGESDNSKIPPCVKVVFVDAPGSKVQVNVGQSRVKPIVEGRIADFGAGAGLREGRTGIEQE